jgi:hypothetical protein
MKHILQTGNIFATNLLYMNDSEEYCNGLRELRQIINDKQKQEVITEQNLMCKLDEEVASYSISFSTTKDLLSQWSMYAGESGVCISIEFRGKEQYRGYKDNEEKVERIDISHSSIIPKKVYYCTQATMDGHSYQKVAKDIWKFIETSYTEVTLSDIKGNAKYIWTEMTPYVKRYEFSAEEEYRLVFDWMQSLERLRIDYRNDGNVLKPYLDIECFGGWPIREITVGPGFNQNAVFKSILHFLNHKKLMIPQLSNYQFAQRCKNYLESCGSMPECVEKIWNARRSMSDWKNEQERYNFFCEIKRVIENLLDLNDPYIQKLKNSELSKPGIILTKSAIPYIF